MDDLRLARLLCTRLCHDLAGPVGSVNNGLELLADPAVEKLDDVIELIRGSASQAALRLRFLRAAYDVAGGKQTLADARRLTEAFFEGRKIVLDWPRRAPSPAFAARDGLAQLLLNMILCAADALPRGGRVSVRLAIAKDTLTVRVVATGAAVNVVDRTRQGIADTGKVSALDARSVSPHFTARLAAAMGGAIEFTTPARGSAGYFATVPAKA